MADYRNPSDSGVVGRGDHRQYSPLSQPFVDSQTPDLRLRRPVYPDIIRRTARVVMGGATFPIQVEAAPTVPDLVPQQPTVPTRLRRTQPSNATWTPQHSSAEGRQLDWISRYPDKIYRKFIQPALMMDYAAPSSLTISSTDMRWLGEYPDFISRRKVPAWVPFETSVSSARAIGHMGWEPTYPDRIVRSKVAAWAHLGAWNNRVPDPVVVPDLVTSFYVDRVYRNLPRPHLYQSFTELALRTPAPHGSWIAKYPDRINTKKLHPALIQFTSKNVHIVQAQGAVTFSYPDEVPAKKSLHASRQQALGYQHNFAFVDMSWLSYAPSMVRVKKRHPLPDFWGDGREGISNLPSPHLAWQPEYPDYIWRHKVHASRVPFRTADPKPVFISTDPRFLASYPNKIYRTVLTNQQHMFSMNLDPIVNPPAPDMSWQGTYPHAIVRQTLPVAARPSVTWADFQSRVVRNWYGIYPDRIWRVPQTPTGFMARTIPVIEIPATPVTFPDTVESDSLHRQDRTALFQPNLSVFPAIGIEHAWDPEFPDFARRGTTHPPLTQFAWAQTPLTIVSGIDCIALKDGVATIPMLAMDTITAPTFTDESLTTGDHTSVEYC